MIISTLYTGEYGNNPNNKYSSYFAQTEDEANWLASAGKHESAVKAGFLVADPAAGMITGLARNGQVVTVSVRHTGGSPVLQRWHGDEMPPHLKAQAAADARYVRRLWEKGTAVWKSPYGKMKSEVIDPIHPSQGRPAKYVGRGEWKPA